MPLNRNSFAHQVLMFDADDTLWENNIYFEQAIATFISYLDHQVHTVEQVREHLNHCERLTTAQHGYGLGSFRLSLIRCFEDLTSRPVTPQQHDQIVSFVEAIAAQEIAVLPHVEETLQQLAQRHTLFLVTKGDPAEQLQKLDRSHLASCFQTVEVLMEKNEAAYRTLARTHNLATESTWMIGNSPKSDVNPALAAGMNAVFLPHDFTWILEHESVSSPQRGRHLLQLKTINELLTYF